ncbi:MAG: YabP/YqfC family sporulation protein [Clostridia bacterium]|nr:YabP/YqfC family sporulation protein [Clostridia bacterium]
MRLYDEIFKDAEGFGAKMIVAVDGGGYFEGVKSVGEFTPERMVLYFSKKGVEIEGENLFIETYTDGDLRVGGRISLVKLVKDR